MEKVNIIIPIYNSEEYLFKCLDSIKNQTLEGIKAILVNDGSTDNSGKILWIPGVKKSNFDKEKNEKYDIIIKYILNKEENNE